MLISVILTGLAIGIITTFVVFAGYWLFQLVTTSKDPETWPQE